MRGIRIGFVKGQDGERSGGHFKKQLNDWLRYCWKRSPNVDLTLRERVVAAGALEKRWRAVAGNHSNGPYMIREVKDGVLRMAADPSVPENDHAADGVRKCRGCNKPLPPDFPSNKWHHGPACRSLARKKREKATRGRVPIVRDRETPETIASRRKDETRDDLELRQVEDSREEYRERGDP